MQLARILGLGCLILMTLSCTMHRVEIQQGNVITPEMVAQLKPGMTRQQVQFVMGTASIMDPFHPNRWDYMYILRIGEENAERRHVTVYFDGDQLLRVEDEQDGAGG
ncbi:MAG: outer membrane protein assembly factor BamE [Gammaproteobacteria bacterium]